MSVAEQLGTGASFGGLNRAARSARGRAKAKAEGEIPAYDLVRIPLDRVATSPLNPRRNFGTDEELAEFGEELRRAQLAACVVVSVGAYLALWPEHEPQLAPGCEVVLLNGERRLRSGRQAGLETLDFVIRDDLAESREAFLENLLKENLARQDFDVIERAHGVAAMVELCTATNPEAPQQAAARRFGKDSSWVTNQLLLLRLPAAVQGMLSAKVMPERHGRVLARQLKKQPTLTSNELVDLWAEIKADEERVRLERRQEARRRAAGSAQLSMDNSQPPAGASGDSPPPAAEVPAQLSMDNWAPGAGPAAGPEDPGAVALELSMDNSRVVPAAPPLPAPGPEGAVALSVPAPQLSMDNSEDRQVGGAAVPSKARTPRSVVEVQLEASARDQAALLASALGAEKLAALWEEIHALMK